MPAALLEQLSQVTVEPEAAERLGIAPGVLALKRAWPAGGDHLVLEYVDGRGRVVAGQWRAQSEDLEQALAKTVRITATACILDGVLVQAGGADAKLQNLHQIAHMPAAEVLAHRAERRAVVRHEAAGVVRYAKVTAARKVRGIVEQWERARRAARGHVDTPDLCEWDEERGITCWSALKGCSMHELLGSAHAAAASGPVGEALAHLHGGECSGLQAHGAAEEAAVLRQWHGRLRPFDAEFAEEIAGAIESTAEALVAAAGSRHGVIHRDLHDKQVFITEQGRVEMLDFDLLAAGEPELDLGNWTAHLQLRAIQGEVTQAGAEEAAAEFLGGYGVHDERRLRAYARSSLLRLACVYSFRPRWPGVAARLAALAHST
jgi:tRNA A-37 threonylcarbamoyl transferase component Bud32